MLLRFNTSSARVLLITTLILSSLLFLHFHNNILSFQLPKSIALDLKSASSKPQGSPISKKLWYKLGPRGLSNESREWTNTCILANPDYESTFLTDIEADTFVKSRFSNRPDITSTYLALTIPIVKADFLRYLLLYAEGGIWSDLDVTCNAPIQEWIPAEYTKNASLVLGWEFDSGYEMGWSAGFIRQFATWTLMAAPRSRHMGRVIDDLLANVKRKTEEHNCTVAELRLDTIGDVVDLSGPRMMTSGVINSLGVADRNLRDGSSRATTDPILIQDVLILPGYAFANSTNRWEPGVVTGRSLVTHHYAGSWKNKNGGELAR